MKLKYLGMLLAVIGLAFLYFYINPREVNFLPKCLLLTSTGIYCPGCGSQRAAHELLHFNIWKALQQNLLFIVGLFILLYYLIIKMINIIFNKNLKSYLDSPKFLFLFLIIIITFWILRNIPIHPFNILAPK
ncbi:DUF2752 domain-containing protein [Lutibacter citreus]|uniref:DUF2752 domain-containing protein n=1 Tax=Lutibacter citreus TaxID=2138210 RepID=UPI000DBE350E|nr:DUF2752 domain-containing protein [Lutibacter citreus]